MDWPFFTEHIFSSNEPLQNYGDLDLGNQQAFPQEWRKRTWHFKENNRYYLLLMTVAKSEVGRLSYDPGAGQPSTYFNTFLIGLVLIWTRVLNEMYHHSEQLPHSASQYFQSGSCMILQSHAWGKESSQVQDRKMDFNRTENEKVASIPYSALTSFGDTTFKFWYRTKAE